MVGEKNSHRVWQVPKVKQLINWESYFFFFFVFSDLSCQDVGKVPCGRHRLFLFTCASASYNRCPFPPSVIRSGYKSPPLHATEKVWPSETLGEFNQVNVGQCMYFIIIFSMICKIKRNKTLESFPAWIILLDLLRYH